MKSESTFDFHIRWAWARISRLYNQQAAEYGGTMSIGYALLNIDREGTPSTKLGPKMGMEPTSLSRTLKTMEEKGLIRRQADLQDKRKVLIFLTQEGIDKRRIAKHVVLDFNERLVANIPKGKLKTFFEVAERLDTTIDIELNNI